MAIKSKDIIDFFDPYNVEHLVAYKVLDYTGNWPENFIPEDISFSANWQIVIAFKMALVLVKLGIDGQIIGMPPHVPPSQFDLSKLV